MGLSLQNANFHLKFKYGCKLNNLYILRGLRKLVIVFLIPKNTHNLINLSLFLIFFFFKVNLYILKGFKKLVIIFLISKNTHNLINLSLFLKFKNKNKKVNL